MLESLTENEIDYRHYFHPLHKQPFIDSPEILLNSETSFDTGILLPIFNELSNDEIKFISQTIINQL